MRNAKTAACCENPWAELIVYSDAIVKRVLRITIEHDQDTENPCNSDGFVLYSFNTRHASFVHLDEIKTKVPRLKAKLTNGTAFWLGYFEHGQSQWALSGEQHQDRWDSRNMAGLLVWTDKPSHLSGVNTYAARAQQARSFLEIYTNWVNGACYWYRIEVATVPRFFSGEPAAVDWEEIASCGGFIGEKHLVDDIQDTIWHAKLQGAELLAITGDCAWIADYHDLMLSTLKEAG